MLGKKRGESQRIKWREIQASLHIRPVIFCSHFDISPLLRLLSAWLRAVFKCTPLISVGEDEQRRVWKSKIVD